MSQKTTLSSDSRLTKDNFEQWRFLISNVLKAKKIQKYVESDVVSKLKEQLTTEKTNPKSTNIESLEKEIEEAEAKDAEACSIISNNVTKGVLDYIKNLSNAYEIMEKLQSLYGKEKSADVQYWMKKMYSLKARNLSECKDVINKIKEIFDIMAKNKASLGDWEKIRIYTYHFQKS